MYLKDFGIFLNKYSIEDREQAYDSIFRWRIYFIVYSLLRFLRKIRFETDGTFEEVCLRLGMRKFDVEMYPTALSLYVDVPFDFERYDNSDDEGRCKYYVELVRQAFTFASTVKPLPLAEIMGFLDTLEANNYTYSWDFKSVIDWGRNLKFRFTIYLDTYALTLRLQAIKRKTKALISEGVVARTLPDIIFLRDLTRDVHIENDKIYIKAYPWLAYYYIEINPFLEGKIVTGVISLNEDCPFSDKYLHYTGYDYRYRE